MAELLESGSLPFVPDSGGQAEIVSDPNLLYRDMDDAVAKIHRILSDKEKAMQLSSALSLMAGRFATSRFIQDVQCLVSDLI